MENNNAFLNNVNTLLQMYSTGLLGGERMPEDVLINVVKDKR